MAAQNDIHAYIGAELCELLSSTRLGQCGKYIQHGDTSVLLHCAAVAFYSCKLCSMMGLGYRRELVRGALLHDYFLYDWHCPGGKARGLHGFTHPSTALENACRDTRISPAEADIIKHHMFPLTPVPPKSAGGWIICLTDKLCSLYETFSRNTYGELRKYIGEVVCNV